MTRTLDTASTSSRPTPALSQRAALVAHADGAGAAGAGGAGGPAFGSRCRAVVGCAFEFLDGELAPARESAVREHLAECAGCRRRIAGDRALLDLIARAACALRCGAPISLRARIQQALGRADLARSAAAHGVRREPAAPPSSPLSPLSPRRGSRPPA